MELKSAIEEQNKAFARKVNNVLGEPIPNELFEKQLAQNEPFKLAALAVKTRKGLSENNKTANSKEKLTKFDRFILWLKRKKV